MKIFKPLLLWSAGIFLCLHCADDPLTVKDREINFSIRYAGITPATPVEVDTVRIALIVKNNSADSASPNCLRVRQNWGLTPVYAIPLYTMGPGDSILDTIVFFRLPARQCTVVVEADPYQLVKETFENDNAFTVTFPVAEAVYDLGVDSIWCVPPHPCTSDTFRFHARVANLGNCRSVDGYYHFYIGDSLLAGYTLMPIEEGETTDVQSFPVLPGPARVCTVSVAANFRPGTVVDADTANNRRSSIITILPPSVDVAACSLWLEPAVPSEADSFRVNAKLTNRGTARSGTGACGFFVNGQSVGLGLLNPINPAETLVVKSGWSAPRSPGICTTRIVARIESGISDADTSNNRMSAIFTIVPATVDVAICSLWQVPAAPTGADSLKFKALVTNRGTTRSGTGACGFFVNGQAVGPALLNPINPAETLTVESGWSAPRPPGKCTTMIIARVESGISDADTSNNRMTAVFAIVPAVLDIEISSLVWRPVNPAENDTLFAEAVITNRGNCTTQKGFYRFRLNGTVWGSNPIFEPLRSGEAITAVAEPVWIPDFTGNACTLSVEAYLQTGPGSEIDTTNNHRSAILTFVPAVLDIEISSLAWRPVNPVENDSLFAEAVITNRGNITTQKGFYRFRLNGTVWGGMPIFEPLRAGEAIAAVAEPVWIPDFAGNACTLSVEAYLQTGPGSETDTANNRMSKIILFGPDTARFADLAVDTAILTPAVPKIGDLFSVLAVIRNRGDGASGPCSVAVVTGKPFRRYELPISSLPPGQTDTIGCSFPLDSIGMNFVRVFADCDSAVAESNETNNSLLREFTVSGGGLNLKFSSIMVLPLSPRTSDTTTISAYIVNSGGSATPVTTATLSLDGENPPVAFSIAALQPFATATIQRKFYFTSPGTHSVRAVVDPDNTIGETDESDNEANKSFTVTMKIGP